MEIVLQTFVWVKKFLVSEVAVSLRAVRLSSRQKINFSETWHTKRVSYTTNKNGKIFLKYSLPAFLEARTHFGPNQAIFHPF